MSLPSRYAILDTIPITKEEHDSLQKLHSEDFNRIMQRLGYSTRAIPGTPLAITRLALKQELATRRNHV